MFSQILGLLFREVMVVIRAAETEQKRAVAGGTRADPEVCFYSDLSICALLLCTGNILYFPRV